MAAGKKFSISVIIGGKSTLGRVLGQSLRQTQRFARGLAGVGRTAWSAGKGVLALGRGVLKLGGYLTAATGVAGAFGVAFFKDIIDRADEVKKFSRQIGWSSEALQTWGYAAELAGVEAGEFQAALYKMTKSVGDARRKTGTLYTLLNKGSKFDRGFLKQLTAASPEEQFDLLIRAMESMPDAQKRAQLAMAAFGRSGGKVARLVEEGSEGLAKLRQEFVDLGGVLTTEDQAAAESFNDNLTRLKWGLIGVGQVVFRELIPGLDAGAGGMVEWFKANREWLGQRIADVIRDVGTAISDAWGWLLDNGPQIITFFSDAYTWVGDLVEGAGRVVEGIGGWETAAVAGTLALGAMAGGPLGLIIAGVALIATYWEDITNWIDKATDAALDYLGVVNPKAEMEARAKRTAGMSAGEMQGDLAREQMRRAEHLYGNPSGSGRKDRRALHLAKLTADKLVEGGGLLRQGGEPGPRAKKEEWYRKDLASRKMMQALGLYGPALAPKDFNETIRRGPVATELAAAQAGAGSLSRYGVLLSPEEYQRRLLADVGMALRTGRPQGEIVVRFEDVPAGTRVEAPKASGVKLTTKTGRRQVGATP